MVQPFLWVAEQANSVSKCFTSKSNSPTLLENFYSTSYCFIHLFSIKTINNGLYNCKLGPPINICADTIYWTIHLLLPDLNCTFDGILLLEWWSIEDHIHPSCLKQIKKQGKLYETMGHRHNIGWCRTERRETNEVCPTIAPAYFFWERLQVTVQGVGSQAELGGLL